MTTRRITRIVIGALVAGVVLGSAALGAVRWRIHQSCWRHCAAAQQAHPHAGDDVAALSDFMNSDSHSIRERNLAVWTLGRLRDPVALPALERVYTGGLCDHDENLCQYELDKAILLCGGTPQPPPKTKH